ncbi:MAG TPA: hypothetical protein PLG84_02830 [Anaerolineaceae bacterium]|nr:hypothetical protein [Anaerolineaceae bacterium]HOE34209.1 hypothetical protein [Anaerolineaceae bacterium]HOT25206.1 hypothetical protein [Anaerolineaceae bacterium]HQH57761.1 hypothetical protein [Anaerolineaceae bacterium]HQK02733.1 hypothetical protein [Anaerolineaceae bacterium]
MKKLPNKIAAAVLLLAFLLANLPLQRAAAQASQPLLYIYSYSPGPNTAVSPWAPFDFTFVLANKSEAVARNLVMTFTSEDFIPLNGGVYTLNSIGPEDRPGTTLRFRVSDYSTWKYSGVINATASYTDDAGTSYSTSFVFYVAIAQSAVASPTKTPTPGPATKPQLVISGYNTDVDPLQPGSAFKLKLKITNAGVADASNVSLVYGGGVSLAPNEQGTPQPGISGSTGDLTNFAPVGSSNVVLLGELPVGASVETEQQFVVNVSTVPGAYPLKVSLVYNAPGGTRAVDDQLITLLVYSLPQLEISFYRDPGMFFNGSTTSLPIQITNLSRKTTVLGNMTVSSESGDLQNNTGLVGTLDPGGYFTWDVMYTPFSEGPAIIKVAINYTDDFNQLRVYESALEIEVQPAEIVPQEPIPGEGEFPTQPEQPVSFWAKIWAAIKGFLGIGTGSGADQPAEIPMEEDTNSVPFPPKY